MKEVPVKKSNTETREKEIMRTLDKLAQIANRKIPLQQKVDKMNNEMLKVIKLN